MFTQPSKFLSFAASVLAACVALPVPAPAQHAPAVTSQSGKSSPAKGLSFDQAVDKIVEQESSLLKLMGNLTPVIETYLQYTKPNRQLGSIPVSDDYFLGQFRLTRDGAAETSYLRRAGIAPRLLNRVAGMIGDKRSPVEFARTLLPDPAGFDRRHYSFSFVRREFLGDVRCLVIEVQPLPTTRDERLLGRIWVEDRDYHIVRFNGTFTSQPRLKPGLHFDSWRLNLLPNVWLPAYVYSEEAGQHATLRYKALTRIWGYDLQHAGDLREFAEPLADDIPQVAFRNGDSAYDLSPQFSKRRYQYSTEDNIIERLQVAGLMAPKGSVDQVLQQVVTNLEITNQLAIEPEVRCRILLTAPLESFSFGHTIVVSRGLLDVLPDEASLAAILAHELAHIMLGHSAEEKYASADNFDFPNGKTLQKLEFSESEQQEEAANRQAMELLAKSPYKEKLGQVGLFLQALQARATELPNLIHPHLGNGLKQTEGVRMAALENSAPKLAPERTDQIAALPLGSRIKIDPWSDRIELRKSAPVPLNYAREKMPFEITPVFPYLKRMPLPQ